MAIAAGAAQARDYYVSPSGSDAAPGTADAPFATIARAAGMLEPGETCWLRAGTYRETVRPARSGEPGKPVTFRSYSGERAIISGADVVQGPWAAGRGRIYASPMPWTMNDAANWWNRGVGGDQVFINGDMVPEARWPNLPDGFNPATVTRNQLARATSGEVIDAGDAKAGALAKARYKVKGLPSGVGTGTKIWFNPACQWTPMTGAVTTTTDGVVDFTCKAISDQKTWNKKEFIYHCRDGDWFYLWGSMSLLDAPGEWLRDDQGLLHVWMPEGVDPAKANIEAKHRLWAFDVSDRAYIAIVDVGIFAAGINSNSASDHLLIDHLDAKYVSHGTWFDWWWGNPVEHEGLYRAGAIQVRGPESEIRNSRIQYSAEAGIVLMGENSRAINNVVMDVGYSGTGAGISVVGKSADRFIVSRNTVHGTGYMQCVDFAYVRDAKITFNDLAGSARLTTDNGVLFGAWSTEDTEIAYNHLHDSMGLTLKDGFEHYYGNAGIYLQDRLVNVAVHHNVVWNCAGGITNNNDGKPEQTDRLMVYNTTTQIGMAATANVTYANNISIDTPGIWPAQVDAKRNLIYGPNASVKDAAFTDAAHGRFTLRKDSPAIDRGELLPPWTDGFVGKAPDMGAYEYGAPAWRPGAVVSHWDLPKLRVTTAAEKGTFIVSGLPDGRGLGDDFVLQVGNNPPASKVAYEAGQWIVRHVPGGDVSAAPPAPKLIENRQSR